MRGEVVLLLSGLLLTRLQAFNHSTVTTFSIDKNVHAIGQFSHFHVIMIEREGRFWCSHDPGKLPQARIFFHTVAKPRASTCVYVWDYTPSHVSLSSGCFDLFYCGIIYNLLQLCNLYTHMLLCFWSSSFYFCLSTETFLRYICAGTTGNLKLLSLCRRYICDV